MPFGTRVISGSKLSNKAKNKLKNNKALGLYAKANTAQKQLKNLQFKKNTLKFQVAGMKTALNKKYPSTNATVSNAVGAYYNGSNTAKQAIKGTPSAQSKTTAKSASKDNLSGSIYEELANKNNELNIIMNRENNAFNAQQAQLQRDWEAQMSNTAHQREVADLKAAGLNPILSAGGTGASTPVASNASASNWTGADSSFISALAQVAASAMSANAVVTSSGLNAAAVERAAAMNSAASMYGSDQALKGTMYGADQSAKSYMYGADKAFSGTKYSSDKSYKASNIRTATQGATDLLKAIGMMIPG